MTRRTAILLVVLLATLAATWWTASLEEDAAPVEPSAQPVGAGAARTASSPADGPAPAAVPVASVPAAAAPVAGTPAAGRAPWPDSAVGLFQPYSVHPPAAAAPPPLAVEPAAAAVPPLPFRFVGALEDRGQRSVILLEADTVHVLRAGERVDTRYRVERITRTEVVFTYLPAHQRQTLDLSTHDPSH